MTDMGGNLDKCPQNMNLGFWEILREKVFKTMVDCRERFPKKTCISCFDSTHLKSHTIVILYFVSKIMWKEWRRCDVQVCRDDPHLATAWPIPDVTHHRILQELSGRTVTTSSFYLCFNTKYQLSLPWMLNSLIGVANTLGWYHCVPILLNFALNSGLTFLIH
jgi:hypothetical protein